MRFLIDTNILLYAANTDCEEHLAARGFLQQHLAEATPMCLTWGIVYEFLRVSTHARVFSPPLRSREALQFLDVLFEHVARPHGLAHVGLDEAGRYRVDPDVVCAQLRGEDLREHDQRGLGDTICPGERGRPEARDRRHVDDVPAVLAHPLFEYELCEEEHAVDVYVERLVPRPFLYVDRGAEMGVGSRIVYEDVYLAEPFERLVHEILELIEFAGVHRHGALIYNGSFSPEDELFIESFHGEVPIHTLQELEPLVFQAELAL